MSCLLRRKRKIFTSSILGLWLFALCVGIANACSWDGVTSVSHHPMLAVHPVDNAVDHDQAPGCDDFCSNDIPVLGVLKLVQDQPAGQPLALAAHYYVGVLPTSAPVLRLARTTHPPPGVPFSLRTVRLTL